MNWRDEYDSHADRDRAAVDALPVEQLLDDVRQGSYGDYYNIWYSIAERASLETAGWILFDVLNRDIEYLYRYHCAAALLSLVKVDMLEPVQLSGGPHHGTASNLARLRSILEERLSPGPRDRS